MRFVKYPHVEWWANTPADMKEAIVRSSYVVVQRKYDGQNVFIYNDLEKDKIRIASRNFADASADIEFNVKRLSSFLRISNFLRFNPEYGLYFEHRMSGGGPTNKERPLKRPCMVLLDAVVLVGESDYRLLKPRELEKISYEINIPTPYQLYVLEKPFGAEVFPLDINQTYGPDILKYCKKNKWEGVVFRAFNEDDIQVGIWKLKQDVGVRLKRAGLEGEGYLGKAPMSREQALRAVRHAIQEVERNGGDIRTPKDAMPVVAEHIAQECREHNLRAPGKFFNYYQEYLNNREAIDKELGEQPKMTISVITEGLNESTDTVQ